MIRFKARLSWGGDSGYMQVIPFSQGFDLLTTQKVSFPGLTSIDQNAKHTIPKTKFMKKN